jgi:transportin-3
VLGGERTLQLLTEPLAAVGAQVASGGAFDWATAEAALYCVRTTHRCPLSYLCKISNRMF